MVTLTEYLLAEADGTVVAGRYQQCGRCFRLLQPGKRYRTKHAPVKDGRVVYCDSCKRNEVYGRFEKLAAEWVRAVLEEGEAQYPNVDFRAIYDKDDHLDHTKAHLDALEAGDESEDHLTHAGVRLFLEWVRREENRKDCAETCAELAP